MVHVEFVIAALTFLTMIMGIAQIMLMDAGKLAVMRAANAAARAAVVILDDDPRAYGGEPRNQAARGSQRHAEIERAAAGALVAVDTPAQRATDEDTVMNAVASPDSLSVTQLLTPSSWLRSRVRVTFPSHKSGRVGMHDDVTARVEFDFPCIMPVVRYLLCGRTGRTRVLSSEATLPNQGAPYEYKGPPPAGSASNALSEAADSSDGVFSDQVDTFVAAQNGTSQSAEKKTP